VHEYGLIQSLIDRVEAEAHKHGARAVRRLRVRLGELAGVDGALLSAAWETFRERTLCSGAPLELVPVPARWECARCHAPVQRGAILRCPACASPARLVEGDDLILERIELDVP
jgi:hydrogenase nickel incorporation protein HypA/HybF